MRALAAKWTPRLRHSKWLVIVVVTGIGLAVCWACYRTVGSPLSAASSSEGDLPKRIGSSSGKRVMQFDKTTMHVDLATCIKRWDTAENSGNDENLKFNTLRGIASLMAINGYSREAIEKINSSFGPGKARCQIISEVFRFSKNSDDLPELFNLLEFEDEKVAASEGIGRALALASGPIVMDVRKYGYLKGNVDVMLATFAELYVVQNSSGSTQDLAQAFKLAFDLPLSEEVQRITLRKLASIAPFDCWDYITKRGLNLYSREAAEIVQQMVRTSGRATAERLLLSPQSADFLDQSLLLWMRVDASEPVNWMKEESARMTAVQRDKAYSGIVTYSVSQGELDTARKWADLIVDLEQRKKVDGRIWAAERDKLRMEIGKDPVNTVQSIISGQSKYGDYWLEEAMGTWMAKDLNAAQKWYQQNWNTLPAGKSQFVAAAFANQAVQQGDIATAKHWAVYIQDAKTKQRIEAGITKAEGKNPN
jgi:hypothetical protein